MNERLTRMYAAFNARDADAVLVEMTPDVAWPKAFEGGWVQGREAVRAYWARQWSEIAPTVEPLGFEALLPDGRVAVRVRQTVRDLAGALLGQGEVRHTYTFAQGLIARMEIEA